ncbi:putative membrane protein YedE/YeeE [Pantoea alhagi]|nr:putative membrane protein YedE/YeeE [Pantoea alhagi]
MNKRLVGGAVLFGIGWGLSGICPGPALILLSSGSKKGALFFMAMLVGMGLFDYLERRRGKA